MILPCGAARKRSHDFEQRNVDIQIYSGNARVTGILSNLRGGFGGGHPVHGQSISTKKLIQKVVLVDESKIGACGVQFGSLG